jgi:sugar phosphate isomerase/epimerase
MTPVQLIEKAAELGVEVVQCCENISLESYDRDYLEEMRRVAEAKGIALEIGVQDVDLANLRAYLKMAEVLDARLCRIALNTHERHPGFEESVKIIDELLASPEARGIVLALENHFHFNSEQMLRLAKHYENTNVGICLDTANSTGLLEPPRKTVDTLAPYAVSFHLKDYKVEQAKVGYRIFGAPLGEGLLDIPAVLKTVKEKSKDPNVILEQWIDTEDTEEATLREEDRWVRHAVDYVSKLL